MKSKIKEICFLEIQPDSTSSALPSSFEIDNYVYLSTELCL